MKRLIWTMALSVFFLTACEKNDSNAENLMDGEYLLLGIDGDTDLKLAELNAVINIDPASLTEEEKAGLLQMREEEKLAHDLYVEMYDQYELRIFSNISMSEANHMEAVLMLLESAGLGDPAMPESGVFANVDLQTTYDQLLQSGTTSLVDALKAGAYVEELDILDLEEQLKLVSNESIRLVYTNLLRGSRNHLRAFTRILAANEVEYAPVLLSSAQFEEIIGGEMEKGGSCNSNKKGNRTRGKK